jgi:hypothetical protein
MIRFRGWKEWVMRRKEVDDDGDRQMYGVDNERASSGY